MKSILIREEVHRQLKTEAVRLGVTMRDLAEYKLSERELSKKDIQALTGSKNSPQAGSAKIPHDVK